MLTKFNKYQIDRWAIWLVLAYIFIMSQVRTDQLASVHERLAFIEAALGLAQ